MPEPQISWDKILCPVCGEPTGNKSRCEEIEVNKPKKVAHPIMGTLPVLSSNCVFKQDNLWSVSINYPVSAPLIETLSKISGVEKIVPVKSYTMHLVIGKLFDEKEVQRNINIKFRTLIKELIVSSQSAVRKETATYFIIMPNGSKYGPVSEEIKCEISSHFQDVVLE
jgi:hypothetical protein